MRPLSESTIIVCSIVRNAARGLRRNIPVIDRLCDMAGDYKVVVYENDSKDHTKEILNQWAAQRGKKNIHVLLNDIDENKVIPPCSATTANPFFCKQRIAKMVALRNNYMEYIANQNWQADYLIVADLDVEDIDLDGILSSFSTPEEWDAVTAFGYSLSPKLRFRYHDTYALTEFDRQDDVQTEEMIYGAAGKYKKIKENNGLYRVFSAFGGLAIYRFTAIKDLKYQLLGNNDPRVEAHCEHYSIYRQMQAHGYDKVYINPRMKLKYQRISLKLIFNTLKRRLKIA